MLKIIKDFPNYAITQDGKVWSFKKNKWLKPEETEKGYLRVSLVKDRKLYHKKIHRLVAETFTPKTEEDIRLNRNCIDHIDGNRQNNHISNLKWCTHTENMNNPLTLKKLMNKKNRAKPILVDGVEYESTAEASRQLGIPYQTIIGRLKSKNFKSYKKLGQK